jgi:hypothetical protein
VCARVVPSGDGVRGSLFFLRNINCWFQMSIWKYSRIKEPLVLGTWNIGIKYPLVLGICRINWLPACSSYFKILEELPRFGSLIFQKKSGSGYFKRLRIKEPLVQRTTGSSTRLVFEKKIHRNNQLMIPVIWKTLKNCHVSWTNCGFSFMKKWEQSLYINPDICCERKYIPPLPPPPTLVMTYDIKAYELYTM